MYKDICLIASELIHRTGDICFKEPVSLTIERGEHWAFVGANGSGKTRLADTIAGKFALKSGRLECFDDLGVSVSASSFVKTVAFRDIYSLADSTDAFYQQRWNMGVMQEGSTARSLVPGSVEPAAVDRFVERFGMEELLDKDIRLLSSGELRKFLVLKSLVTRPGILILDNPYIGLDAASRLLLNQLFDEIAQSNEVQLILLLSDPADIPPMITHIQPLSHCKLLPPMTKAEFSMDSELMTKLFPPREGITLPATPPEEPEPGPIAELREVRIAYGKRTILEHINWTIQRGEKWALLGPNGSGKSTLLSLISGDNPQAYANDIRLFGRKRGTGESIWDIKKRIGYISPEMHQYYLKNIPCLDIVGSGFFDTVGLYLTCSESQKQLARQWMDVFGIGSLEGRRFLQISTGEQRLVLLARLFVKNPSLLILDEAFHGLDVRNKENVKSIIENFCNREKSLIFVSHYEEEIPKIVDKRYELPRN